MTSVTDLYKIVPTFIKPSGVVHGPVHVSDLSLVDLFLGQIEPSDLVASQIVDFFDHCFGSIRVVLVTELLSNKLRVCARIAHVVTTADISRSSAPLSLLLLLFSKLCGRLFSECALYQIFVARFQVVEYLILLDVDLPEVNLEQFDVLQPNRTFDTFELFL